MDPDIFVHDHMATAGRYLLPSVRPLISIDRHNEPEAVGSSVLLWHRGRRYLLSAAHVLDVFKERPLFVGTQTRWHQIVGDFRTTTIPAGGSREDDPYDYGLLAISDDDAAQLDGCRFLTSNQVATEENPEFATPYRSKYLALGWPRNRLNFIRRERATEPTNLAFSGVIAAEGIYKSHGRDWRHHILIEYDPKEMTTRTGQQVPPSFDGLSGGGIFTLPGLTRVGDVAPPRLVGITIEVWRDRDLYVGTRIDLIRDALDAASA